MNSRRGARAVCFSLQLLIASGIVALMNGVTRSGAVMRGIVAGQAILYVIALILYLRNKRRGERRSILFELFHALLLAYLVIASLFLLLFSTMSGGYGTT